ncbi:hypothetical protein CLU79DRAFT_716998 [Phycomyces nitens]|nr:hypothetical protein CLU79DRAFT_716998 [Phycomyces nitens]
MASLVWFTTVFLFILLGSKALGLEISSGGQHNCTFSHNNTLYFYGQGQQTSPALYSLYIGSSNQSTEWKKTSFQPQDVAYCGVYDGSAIFVTSPLKNNTIQTIDLARSTMNVATTFGALPETPGKPPMRSAVANGTLVLFDGASSRDTWLLSTHAEPKIWTRLAPTDHTPPGTTLGEFVVADKLVYHFSTESMSAGGPSPVIITGDGMGRVFVFSASPNYVWNITMSEFASQPLHVQPLYSGIQPTLDTNAALITLNNTKQVVLYRFMNNGLTFYDPLANIPLRTSATVSSPLGTKDDENFWNTKLGRGLEIGLGVGLSVLVIGLMLCLCMRRQRKQNQKVHEAPESIQPDKDEQSLAEEVFQPAPLPQHTEDAETWSRRVLRLLTSITPDRSVFSRTAARAPSRSSRRTQQTQASDIIMMRLPI